MLVVGREGGQEAREEEADEGGEMNGVSDV